MKICTLLVIGLALSGLTSQSKRVLVIEPFTVAAGVELPYDMKQLQAGLVADLRVQIGKEFEVVGEVPAAPKPGLHADRRVHGMAPRQCRKTTPCRYGLWSRSSDLHYRVVKTSGQNVVDQTDTIRTEFLRSECRLGRNLLVDPIAQKIAGRITEAKLQ